MKRESFMKKSLKVLRVGTRSSSLAIVQTEDSCRRLNGIFSDISFKAINYSSPGDRDKESDLITADADFFTKDLDNALLLGEIDCAIHSAKDIAYPVDENIDWFWLPWSEDSRDVFIISNSASFDSLPKNLKIGVSSERRIKWCKKDFQRENFCLFVVI